MKYPKVPKILQSVPLHLMDMTDKQWDASVLWYSKLPLKEIRKRQSITQGQKEDLYQRTRAKKIRMSAHDEMAWRNLDIIEDILTQAAMRKMPRYKANPKQATIYGKLSKIMKKIKTARWEGKHKEAARLIKQYVKIRREVK